MTHDRRRRYCSADRAPQGGLTMRRRLAPAPWASPKGHRTHVSCPQGSPAPSQLALRSWRCAMTWCSAPALLWIRMEPSSSPSAMNCPSGVQEQLRILAGTCTETTGGRGWVGRQTGAPGL